MITLQVTDGRPGRDPSEYTLSTEKDVYTVFEFLRDINAYDITGLEVVDDAGTTLLLNAELKHEQRLTIRV